MDSDDDESFIIPASEVREYIDKIEEVKLRIYNTNLRKCFQRIKISIGAQKDYCYYEIQSLLFGEPAYDKEKCILYMMKRLKKAGYEVRRRKKNKYEIKISWGVKETKEETINKALLSKFKKLREKEEKQRVPEPPTPQAQAKYPFYNLAVREELIKQLEKRKT